jgi:hypothetical protein
MDQASILALSLSLVAIVIIIAVILIAFLVPFNYPYVYGQSNSLGKNQSKLQQKQRELEKERINGPFSTDVVLYDFYMKGKEDIVIVTSHWKEKLSWLSESPWKVVVCDKEGSELQNIFKPEPSCLCKNVGRETTSYLKFIIANYENLPEKIAFIHGHEEAWHQLGPNLDQSQTFFKSKLLNLILVSDTDNNPYLTLNNCWFDDRMQGNKNFEYLLEIWDEHFKPFLRMPAPKNKEILHDCCAQFIVSKDLILRKPKQAYQYWHELFFDHKMDSMRLGYCFEYVWHLIMDQPARVEKKPFPIKTRLQ